MVKTRTYIDTFVAIYYQSSLQLVVWSVILYNSKYLFLVSNIVSTNKNKYQITNNVPANKSCIMQYTSKKHIYQTMYSVTSYISANNNYFVLKMIINENLHNYICILYISYIYILVLYNNIICPLTVYVS